MIIETILRRKGTNVTTIAPEATVKRAADWLRAKNIGALVVTNENEVLGLISEREIVHALSRHGEAAGRRHRAARRAGRGTLGDQAGAGSGGEAGATRA